MNIDIKEISSLLRITEIAADIYIELLINSELSRKKLAVFTNYDLSEVDQAIEELISRGLITAIENSNQEEVFQALSIMQVEEKLERDKQVFKNLQKFVIPKIQAPDKLEILKYEGWEGIRQVYMEVLEEAIKTGEDIYAFESNLDNSELGDEFLNSYVSKRVKNKVTAHVICPTNSEDVSYKESTEGKYTKIRLINSFPMDANFNIVGELVMVFSTDANPRGVLRRNAAEAKTLKAVFEQLWNR